MRFGTPDAAARAEATYRGLLDATDHGFCLLQMIRGPGGDAVDYRFLDVNPAFGSLTGLADARGRTVRALVPDVDRYWIEAYGRVAATGESTRFERQAPTGRWFRGTAFRIGEPSDGLVAVLFSDVTGERVAEASLRAAVDRARSMDRFRRSAMELVEEGLSTEDPHAFYARILERAVRVIPGAQSGSLLVREADGMFGYAATIGFDLDELRQVRFDEAAAGWYSFRDTPQPHIVVRPELHPHVGNDAASVLRAAGKSQEILAVLVVPVVVDGTPTAFLTLDNFDAHDAFGDEALEMARLFGAHVGTLIKRFALEEELYRLAYRDALTGIANRTRFEQHLEGVLEEAERNGDEVVLLFVDLDHLKPINDTWGHRAGDQALRVVASRLEGAAPRGAFLARLGGDEFVLVILGRDVTRVGRWLARRILEVLAEPIPWRGRELHLTASVGISVRPRHARTGEDLLRYADIAMYHAKQSGKNTYAMFDRTMDAAAQERLVHESELRRALARDEFVLHYQPRIDVRSGRIASLEALVRWQHPAGDLVPPARFIPAAETTSLIHDLGRRILEMAVDQVRAWRDAGFRDCRVAVNLSAHQLARTDFVDEVRTLLERASLPPGALEVEVLESVAMQDVLVSARALSRLKALGVAVALDDFGTGYSNLAYLQELPLDTIKIDRRFLAGGGDEQGEGDLAIVRAVTALGEAFGVRVVAEGVEHAHQWERVRAIGCHEAQGFLIARPLPAADVEPLLRRASLAPGDAGVAVDPS